MDLIFDCSVVLIADLLLIARAGLGIDADNLDSYGQRVVRL